MSLMATSGQSAKSSQNNRWKRSLSPLPPRQSRVCIVSTTRSTKFCTVSQRSLTTASTSAVMRSFGQLRTSAAKRATRGWPTPSADQL